MRRRRGADQGRRRQVLIALWCAAVVLFNFPMLIVFDQDATVFGLPLLPVALFAIWGLLIGALALVLERDMTGSDDAERPMEPSLKDHVAPRAAGADPDEL